jgi:hypothetical protein
MAANEYFPFYYYDTASVATNIEEKHTVLSLGGSLVIFLNGMPKAADQVGNAGGGAGAGNVINTTTTTTLVEGTNFVVDYTEGSGRIVFSSGAVAGNEIKVEDASYTVIGSVVWSKHPTNKRNVALAGASASTQGRSVSIDDLFAAFIAEHSAGGVSNLGYHNQINIPSYAGNPVINSSAALRASGATIDSGLTVTAGGATISAGGLSVTGGETIATGGLTIQNKNTTSHDCIQITSAALATSTDGIDINIQATSGTSTIRGLVVTNAVGFGADGKGVDLVSVSSSTTAYGIHIQAVASSSATHGAYGLYIDSIDQTGGGEARGIHIEGIDAQSSSYASGIYVYNIDATAGTGYGNAQAGIGVFIKDIDNTGGHAAGMVIDDVFSNNSGDSTGIKIRAINTNSAATHTSYGLHIDMAAAALETLVWGIYLQPSANDNVSNRLEDWVGIGTDPTLYTTLDILSDRTEAVPAVKVERTAASGTNDIEGILVEPVSHGGTAGDVYGLKIKDLDITNGGSTGDLIGAYINDLVSVGSGDMQGVQIYGLDGTGGSGDTYGFHGSNIWSGTGGVTGLNLTTVQKLSTGADDVYGINMQTLSITNGSATGDVYGMYMGGLTNAGSGDTYGIYIDNNPDYGLYIDGADSYGIYINNMTGACGVWIQPIANATWAIGVEVAGVQSGSSSDAHGIKLDNIDASSTGNAYGLRINNIDAALGVAYGIYVNDIDTGSLSSHVYGLYINDLDTASGTGTGNVYGIYVNDIDAVSSGGNAYGIYINSIKEFSGASYGIYINNVDTYSIYVESTSATSWFKTTVFIGTSTTYNTTLLNVTSNDDNANECIYSDRSGSTASELRSVYIYQVHNTGTGIATGIFVEDVDSDSSYAYGIKIEDVDAASGSVLGNNEGAHGLLIKTVDNSSGAATGTIINDIQGSATTYGIYINQVDGGGVAGGLFIGDVDASSSNGFGVVVQDIDSTSGETYGLYVSDLDTSTAAKHAYGVYVSTLDTAGAGADIFGFYASDLDAAGSAYGVYVSDVDASGGTAYGFYSNVTAAGGYNYYVTATGVAGLVYGYAVNALDSTNNNAYGFYANNLDAAGGGKHAYGVYINTVDTAGAGGDAYGFYANDIDGAGSAYGLYLSDVTASGGTAYFIYCEQSAASKFEVRTNGDVNIAGDCTITGALSKGSGTFKITHPQDKNKWLLHSFSETPEYNVFYRGEAQLENGECIIELPGYFEALTAKEDRSITLTCKNGFSPLYYTDVENGKFKVYLDEDAGFGKANQKFSWRVDARRNDDFIRNEAPYTDKDGKLTVETEKEEKK